MEHHFFQPVYPSVSTLIIFQQLYQEICSLGCTQRPLSMWRLRFLFYQRAVFTWYLLLLPLFHSVFFFSNQLKDQLLSSPCLFSFSWKCFFGAIMNTHEQMIDTEKREVLLFSFPCISQQGSQINSPPSFCCLFALQDCVHSSPQLYSAFLTVFLSLTQGTFF